MPLYLQGIPAVLFGSFALGHAGMDGLWGIVALEASWLLAFLTLAIGKVVRDRRRTAHPSAP